jgi:hypothetical protein
MYERIYSGAGRTIAAIPKRSSLHHFVYFSGFIPDLITMQNSSYACGNQWIAYPAAAWHSFCGMTSEPTGGHGLRVVKARPSLRDGEERCTRREAMVKTDNEL